MNAWPPDDGATMLALRELQDCSPVPPLPLPTVLRRGRRLRVARTASRVSLVAAAALVAFLLVPGSGSDAVPLGPTQTVTATTLDTRPGALWLQDPPARPTGTNRPAPVTHSPQAGDPELPLGRPAEVSSRWERRRG